MSIFEGFVFAGTDWNDHTNFIIQGFDPGIAPKRWQWISGADSDGALPVEEAHFDNAEMTVRIRIAPQANMDAALAKIGTLVLALQECEKQALGSTATWTPAGSTKTLTAYVVGGEVTGIPQSLSGDDQGWFLRNPAPVVEMKLYRRPFLYGAEVTGAATVTADTNPVQTLTLAGVTGDVPAEARLIVTDAATQSRRHVEWGLQQRYYDVATSLLIDSASLVTSGFAGAVTTRTGAFATNGVIRATLTTTPVAICGTGNLAHVGTYRVKARMFPSTGAFATNINVRLSWKEGDGPLRANDYATWPTGTEVGSFWELDLGLVSIPATTLGTQRWTGQIEASSITAGDTLDIDYITLIPTEGYGKARAPITFQSVTTFSARDEFDQVAGALATKTLPVGGTWTGAGDATDFAVESTGHTVQRSTTGDTLGRFALAGTTAFTDCLVQADITSNPSNVSQAGQKSGIFARYVDTNNFLIARLVSGGLSGGWIEFDLAATVAGSIVGSATLVAVAIPPNTPYTVRLVVDAGGRAAAWLYARGSAPSGPIAYLSHSSLATGGALATGKTGFFDIQPSAGANTRTFDNFLAAVPTVDAVVFSGRVAEIRSDSAIRQDSTGTYYGPINSYRGARFYIPPAGQAARTTRVLVKARRNDVDLFADDQIADSTTVSINYTPRFLGAPR